MPRQARLDAPGVLHHIMIRGIERRKIFVNDRDREDFVERLSKLLPQTETACYAWVLIPNHAHFLFRTGLAPLASIMRRLLTGYAVSFNRRHQRHGQGQGVQPPHRNRAHAQPGRAPGLQRAREGAQEVAPVSALPTSSRLRIRGRRSLESQATRDRETFSTRWSLTSTDINGN